MASGCNITAGQVKKQLTDKALSIAKSVDSAYKLSAIGEVYLPLDSKNIRKNEPYKVRSIVDKTVTKLTKELNLPSNKYGGVIFGGVTYTDGAAIQVNVPNQLLNAYRVKNQEASYEQVFGSDTQYRPEGFYAGDQALAQQEFMELERELYLEPLAATVNPPTIIPSLSPTIKPEAQLKLTFDVNTPNQKGNLGDVGFTEVRCNS
jgi:hypothetical protein